MVDKLNNFRPILLITIIPILFSCASTQQKQSESRDVDFYLSRGTASFHKGQYDQAISDYTKAIEMNPKLAMAYYNRGNAHADKEQYDQAIADYTKVLELNPADAEAYHNRGDAYH